MSSLIDACMQNREKAVLTLLQASNDVNGFDSRGFSPLIAAAHFGHYRLVKMLIRHGAAVDLANPESGRTALHHAAKEGHHDVVRLLVKKYGADVKKTDVAGRGCLHWACLGNSIEVVRALLRYKAPLDLPDLSGYTPFMTAVEYERNEAAELLMKEGAKPKTQNNLKHNALEIADWYGHKRLVEKLTKSYDETKDGDAGSGESASAPAPAAASAAADTGGDANMEGGKAAASGAGAQAASSGTGTNQGT